MKKNILAIIILAATLVNVTLVAILIFTVNPEVKRVNELVTRICEVIDLELESPSAGGDKDIVPIENQENTSIMSGDAVSLKTSADGKNWLAVVDATLTVNKQHEDYAKLNPLIESNISKIKDAIYKEIAKYTKEEIDIPEYKEDINAKILEEVTKLFDGSKFIYDFTISFPMTTPQK